MRFPDFASLHPGYEATGNEALLRVLEAQRDEAELIRGAGD